VAEHLPRVREEGAEVMGVLVFGYALLGLLTYGFCRLVSDAFR
jgi:hypothetical protein